jgi:cytochrome c oxidase subunit 3
MIKNINRNQYQFFPFHLVTPSPWPILLSFTLLGLAIGAVMSMHGYPYGDSLLSLSFVLTLFGMALWFNDIIAEGTFKGDHTKEVKNGLTTGFLLFIVSELFAFLSVFWAFFHSSLSPAIEIGGTWPPQGITPLDVFAIPFLNTMLLLSSGGFVTYGHHALIKGDRRGAIIGTALTILLAVIFTALQYYEYTQASFTISDSVFGSAFYASTGLHGIHVIIGTIFIFVQFVRMIQYHLTDTHHQGHEAAIYYWHFVDLVWIFLFLVVYYWSGT